MSWTTLSLLQDRALENLKTITCKNILPKYQFTIALRSQTENVNLILFSYQTIMPFALLYVLDKNTFTYQQYARVAHCYNRYLLLCIYNNGKHISTPLPPYPFRSSGKNFKISGGHSFWDLNLMLRNCKRVNYNFQHFSVRNNSKWGSVIS